MEYALWLRRWDFLNQMEVTVLILVLMEYALWLGAGAVILAIAGVLILVLMEYALWLRAPQPSIKLADGLNPCSNGICSLTFYRVTGMLYAASVLILVLMEYALWRSLLTLWFPTCLNPCSNGICSLTKTEDFFILPAECLNPCSNGICSLTDLIISLNDEKFLS